MMTSLDARNAPEADEAVQAASPTPETPRARLEAMLREALLAEKLLTPADLRKAVSRDQTMGGLGRETEAQLAAWALLPKPAKTNSDLFQWIHRARSTDPARETLTHVAVCPLQIPLHHWGEEALGEISHCVIATDGQRIHAAPASPKWVDLQGDKLSAAGEGALGAVTEKGTVYQFDGQASFPTIQRVWPDQQDLLEERTMSLADLRFRVNRSHGVLKLFAGIDRTWFNPQFIFDVVGKGGRDFRVRLNRDVRGAGIFASIGSQFRRPADACRIGRALIMPVDPRGLDDA